MSEKPIIFSTPMVQAILDGRKTQTRRVIKPQPVLNSNNVWLLGGSLWENGETPNNRSGYLQKYMPFIPYDVLWVRETWCEYAPEHIIRGQRFAYKADTYDAGEGCRQQYIKAGYPYKWRSSRYMPRAAARLFLRVTDVRVERLQDISDKDAIAEGCTGCGCHHPGGSPCTDCMNTRWTEPPQVEFAELWDSLNAKRGFGLDANPWVWVIDFERVEQCQ